MEIASLLGGLCRSLHSGRPLIGQSCALDRAHRRLRRWVVHWSLAQPALRRASQFEKPRFTGSRRRVGQLPPTRLCDSIRIRHSPCKLSGCDEKGIDSTSGARGHGQGSQESFLRTLQGPRPQDGHQLHSHQLSARLAFDVRAPRRSSYSHLAMPDLLEGLQGEERRQRLFEASVQSCSEVRPERRPGRSPPEPHRWRIPTSKLSPRGSGVSHPSFECPTRQPRSYVSVLPLD